jgi:16S rRNA (guanine966-N2)-methyltransferase
LPDVGRPVVLARRPRAVIRIVAGVAGGRRLVVPPRGRTRPTSDRAREGLFSALGSLEGLRVLDLYAGSGALGLEALSRGAAHATLVESDPAALRALRANVAALALSEARVVADRVERFLDGRPQRYDVALADPPYALDVGPVLLALLAWVGPDGVAVVERATRSGSPWPSGWAAIKERRYGEATLWFGRPGGDR